MHYIFVKWALDRFILKHSLRRCLPLLMCVPLYIRCGFMSFMQMYLTWGPSTRALALGWPPPPHSVSLSMCRRSLPAIVQKEASSHSLSFTRDTLNRDREKSSSHTNLFDIRTIGAMDWTSGQTQIKLSLLRSISLKIWPLNLSYLYNRLQRFWIFFWENQDSGDAYKIENFCSHYWDEKVHNSYALMITTFFVGYF